MCARSQCSHHSPCSQCRQYRQGAFTLMEVLAALVLLALLISTLIPLWSRIRMSQAQMLDQLMAENVLIQIDIEKLDMLLNSGDSSFDALSVADGENTTDLPLRPQWVIRCEALNAEDAVSAVTDKTLLSANDTDQESDDTARIPALAGQWVLLRVIDTNDSAHNDDGDDTDITSVLRYMVAQTPAPTPAMGQP